MKIKFIAEREDMEEYPNRTYSDTCANVTMETVSDPTILELITDFEYFLKGCGYSLPEGASLGYEYEEEAPKDEECGGVEVSWKEKDDPYNDGDIESDWSRTVEDLNNEIKKLKDINEGYRKEIVEMAFRLDLKDAQAQFDNTQLKGSDKPEMARSIWRETPKRVDSPEWMCCDMVVSEGFVNELQSRIIELEEHIKFIEERPSVMVQDAQSDRDGRTIELLGKEIDEKNEILDRREKKIDGLNQEINRLYDEIENLTNERDESRW